MAHFVVFKQKANGDFDNLNKCFKTLQNARAACVPFGAKLITNVYDGPDGFVRVVEGVTYVGIVVEGLHAKAMSLLDKIMKGTA